MNHRSDDGCVDSVDKLYVITVVITPVSHSREAQERACDFIANDRRVKRVRLPFSFSFFVKLKEFSGR